MLTRPGQFYRPLYRPPAPYPTTPGRAFFGAMLRGRRDMISLMPKTAYRSVVAPVGWTRRHIVLVNDPDCVRAILGAEAADYPKSDLMVDALAPLVRDGVFVSHGDVWERQRRMITPAFSHMRVNAAFDAMQQSMRDYIDRFSELADKSNEFSLEEMMSHLTADVVCRTIFSQSLETGDAKQVYRAFAEFQDSVANVRLSTLWLGRAWANVPQPTKVERAASEIRSRIGAMIDAHASADASFQDIASDVMAARDPADGSAFSRDELIDQIGVFFLAGHETTAGALAWTFYILSQDADSASRILSELQPYTDEPMLGLATVKGLEFTRNVFRETLRLYPPLAFVPRVALKPGRIRDVSFPRGALLLISPWLLQRNRDIWTSPDHFDPDRFSPGRENEIPSGGYIPFGLGERICIGAAFAMIEATLIIAELTRRFEFEITNADEVFPAARLTTRTARGIRAKVRRRNQ